MSANLNEIIKIIINKLKNKEFDFALKKTNDLLEVNSNNDFLWNLKGYIFQYKNNLLEAISCFKSALKINPENIEARNNLGLSYQNANKLELANECFNECIKIDPNYLNSLFNLAKLKVITNHIEEAILLFERVIKINKNFEMIYIHLAQAYQNNRQFDKAEKILSTALKKFPLLTKADKLLSMQTNYVNNDKHLNSMLEKIKNHKLNDDKKIDLLFAIGKAYEDKKEISKSFDFYSKGNFLKKKKIEFNINNQKKLFNSIKKKFFKFKNPNKFTNNKKVIFIFGLPRSGTTLVENIVSSHKKVSSVGEINFLNKFFRFNIYKDYEINIKNIDKFLSFDLQKEYFNYLQLFNLKNNIITDKSLNTYFNLGLIRYFFPNSKFIHCKRDAKDNCFSIYKNLFNDNAAWKYNEKDIVDYYTLYKEIMSFWDGIFGNEIFTIQYEELVKNKEINIKKMISYCQLNWDAECLNHQKNNNPIKTLSFNQANKPIYSSSINSSKNFESHLGKMFSILNY